MQIVFPPREKEPVQSYFNSFFNRARRALLTEAAILAPYLNSNEDNARLLDIDHLFKLREAINSASTENVPFIHITNAKPEVIDALLLSAKLTGDDEAPIIRKMIGAMQRAQ